MVAIVFAFWVSDAMDNDHTKVGRTPRHHRSTIGAPLHHCWPLVVIGTKALPWKLESVHPQVAGFVADGIVSAFSPCGSSQLAAHSEEQGSAPDADGRSLPCSSSDAPPPHPFNGSRAIAQRPG